LGERLDELKLGMMVVENTAPMGTAFTISVDARRGITTGISAYDRAVTIRALVDPQMTAADLVTPGHMFPLRAMEGGVLRRAGHTASDGLWRLHGDRLRGDGLQPRALRDRYGPGRRRRTGARAYALRMPHGRRLPLAAL